MIYTDADRLKQLLLKLLQKCIKFTPKGRIQLVVNYSAYNYLNFSVIDTGVGMSEVIKTHLF